MGHIISTHGIAVDLKKIWDNIIMANPQLFKLTKGFLKINRILSKFCAKLCSYCSHINSFTSQRRLEVVRRNLNSIPKVEINNNLTYLNIFRFFFTIHCRNKCLRNGNRWNSIAKSSLNCIFQWETIPNSTKIIHIYMWTLCLYRSSGKVVL